MRKLLPVLFGLACLLLSISANAQTPTISSTLSVSLTGDANTNGRANAGDQLSYTAVVTNTGSGSATGVNLSMPAPANTTLVTGSLRTSTLARPDSYTTLISGPLNGSSVLTNDFGLPTKTVLSFGPSASPASVVANGANSATTDAGGTVVMNTDGTFSYTPSGSFVGYDRFGYTATTTTPPNDAATVTIGVGTPVTAIANSYTITGNVTNTQSNTATALLGNDLGDQRVVTAVNGSPANVGVAVTTAQSGTVTVAANGTFIYAPPAGFEGSDSFTYTANNGLNLPSTATVTLTITGMIWFVNSAAPAGGTGTLAKPFNSVGAFQALNNGMGNNPAAGDNIFVYSGTYSESVVLTLLNTQKLIGQGATASLASITGISPAPGSAALPTTSGTAPTLNTSGSSVVMLGQNNLLRGVALGTSSVVSLTGTSFGTLTVSETSINTTQGALALIIGTVTGSFSSITSTGGVNNFALISVGGSLSINAGTMSGGGATTVPFLVATGTVSVTYSGNLSQANNAPMVSVTSHSGTLTFQTGTLTATNGPGLSFSDADGTYNFNGAVSLNGGDAGVDIINGSAGTFSFLNTTITNPSGIAFNVNGSTASITYNGSISQSNNAALVAVGGTGTVLFQNGTLSATNGSGLQFSNADGTYTFNGTTTLNGGDAGIDIDNGSSGTFSFNSNTSIRNPTGVAYREDGSTSTVTYNGGIRKDNNANTAVDINAKTGGVTTFGGTYTISTGTAPAIDLTNNPGSTVNFTGGNLVINTTSGVGFNATGGGIVNVTGTGNTITKSGNGNALNITGTNAGANGITFASINVTGGTGTAVNISGSTGTKSLGDVDVARSGGGTGIFASNAGTVNTSDGTINSGNQVAVDIDNTALGMRLLAVSSNGSTSGIDLNTTTGSFSVVGTGTTDGSGGTIQNTSNRGASFINTGSVTLKNMNFTDAGTTNLVTPGTGGGGISPGEDPNFNLNANAAIHLVNITGVMLDNLNLLGGAQQGINGNNVTSFTLTNSSVQGAGDEVREDGLHFKDMLGTSFITNTTFGGNNATTDNAAVQIHIENYSGAVGTSVTVDNVNVQSRGFAASGVTWSHGILFVMQNAANADLKVSNSTFNNLFSNSIQANSESTGVFELTVNNNVFTNVGASGITSALNNNGTLRFNIRDNGTAANPTFLRGSNNGVSASININHAGLAGATSVLEGQITNNYIGDNSSSSSASAGGSGIRVFSVASGTMTVRINDNNIRGVLQGILVSMGEDVNPAHTINATIYNNTISVTNSDNGFEGILINAGTSSTNGGAGADQGILRLDMHDNTASTNASAGNADFRIRQRFLTTMQLLNYGGANNNNAAVETYLDVTKNNNPAAGGNLDWDIGNNVSGGGGGFVNTASVPQPTLPSP